MSTSGSDRSKLADAASLGEQLASELRQRWQRGERPLAEEFFERHVELRQSPEMALDVIYEEFCLRQAAGELNVEQDLRHRFPDLCEPLRVMLDCHQLLRHTGSCTDFPVLGDTVAGFRLTAEVGRGARGRVYLATQTDLAGRFVVLKLAPLDGTEHLLLARLQHTNIVPVYSVTDDAARGLRVLCMPYFGRATLASILVALADVPLARRSGQGILNALDRLNEHSDEEAPFAAAARQMLAHVSYVEAACWITACLADALQYAHEHNLVHLDVKPSNILLSNDGQPMLLDFHLAREPLEGAGILSDQLGGTPGYMSPEHEAAMRSLSERQPVTSPVDQRADVFALGAVLYELLGAAPASQKTGSNTLCRANPHVSAGLAGIVAKCLAPVATDRYVSAAALAEDLRRHLTDQPLLGAPNRDWSERWQKWQRRHTHALRVSGTLSVVAMAVALTVMGFWSQFRQRSTSAEQALLQGQTLLQQHHAAEAAATFERGLTSIEDVPLRHDLGRQLRTQLAIARRMIVTDKLHQLADQVRVLAGSESLPAEQLRAVSALCVEFWDQREKILTSLHVERETDVAADLLDVAMFAADVQLRLVPANLGAARVSAIRTLDEAEALFGRSPVLDYQRCLLRGHNSEECRLSLHEITSIRRANDNTRGPAWDHYALGRAFLNSSELDLAAEELRIAVAINPASLWPNFYHGLCAHRLGRYHEAIAAFSVCIGVAPQLAACYHNRGISHAALGHTAAALLDESRAVELAPNLAATWLNSAMLHHKPGEYSAADADLQQAFYHRVDPTTHKREH